MKCDKDEDGEWRMAGVAGCGLRGEGRGILDLRLAILDWERDGGAGARTMGQSSRFQVPSSKWRRVGFVRFSTEKPVLLGIARFDFFGNVKRPMQNAKMSGHGKAEGNKLDLELRTRSQGWSRSVKPSQTISSLKPHYSKRCNSTGGLTDNSGPRRVPLKVKIETGIAEMKYPLNQMEHLGEPSNYAGPECHGVPWELKEKGLSHFRCRVGHAYSEKSLEAALSESLETALWVAVRALEEKVALLKRLASESHRRKHHLTARQFEQRFKELEPAALTRRTVLLKTHS